MEITAAHANLSEILGKILSHALGQRRNEHTLITLGTHANFLQQVVHLTFDRAYLDLRVDKAGGTNHLLDEAAPRFREFVRAWGRRDIKNLVHSVLEFFKCEWTIVQC